MDMDNLTYWPFVVLPPEEQSDQNRQEVRFLETAYAEGFRPALCGGDYRATSEHGREVWMVWRGRRRQDGPQQWELRLFSGDQRFRAMWLDEFACAADAALKWLRGQKWQEVLPGVQEHVVKGPSQHDAQGALVEN